MFDFVIADSMEFQNKIGGGHPQCGVVLRVSILKHLPFVALLTD